MISLTTRHFLHIFLFLAASVGAAHASHATTAPFDEVNPRHSSQKFRGQIMAALTILKNSSNSIALQTYQSLVNHHVRVDEIADLTLHDFKRVLKDYADDSIDIGLRQDQYADLTRDDSAAQKILEEHLAGYQWEDRIYVSRSQSAKDLASTLIHEVNHVLNHSHLHYYAQKIDAFREEYRAFYVEKAALGFDMNDHALTLKIKRQVIRDYHFDELSPDDIGNRPTGFITPSEENWQRAATRD